jgi:hypothetical protein
MPLQDTTRNFSSSFLFAIASPSKRGILWVIVPEYRRLV